MTQSLIQLLAHPRVRIGLGATAVAAVVAVVGLGAFATGGETAPRARGPRLAVTVVPPVEPVVDPGATMDVGELRDGFDRAALERRAEVIDDTWFPPDAYVGADPEPQFVRMPMPTPVVEDGMAMRIYRSMVDRVPGRDALQDGSRNFGFDRPRRDFEGERAARLAARAAAERGPIADPDGAIPYYEVIRSASE
jgi:hypothetical protein